MASDSDIETEIDAIGDARTGLRAKFQAYRDIEALRALASIQLEDLFSSYKAGIDSPRRQMLISNAKDYLANILNCAEMCVRTLDSLPLEKYPNAGGQVGEPRD